MRIVFDTNIFIAAALKGQLAENLIDLAVEGEIVLLTSQDILDELREKLLSKFDRSEGIVDFFIGKIKKVSELIEITNSILAVKRDPDDNKILECAVSGKADLIVSADQDLIKLKTFQGIAIVHPKTLSYTFPKYFKRKSTN